jgi:hypothetical protein
MTKKSKREEKIRANPRNVSLEDFEWLINQYGYVFQKGRHPHFIIGGQQYAYDPEKPMNIVYVKDLLEVIDEFKNSQSR